VIRESFGRPVVGTEPIELPLKILLALGHDATAFWKEPLFNLLVTAEALLVSRDNVESVLRPKIWAGEWKPEQFSEHRSPDFLGIAGAVRSKNLSQTFDVVHCICEFGGNSDDPFLSLGRGGSIHTGMLRDALVEARTRLLILQSLEKHLNRGLSSERMAEFIVGAGGPTVLVVAGGEMEPLNAIVPKAKRVTLYASSKDRALAFSKTVHGYDRAGESGEKIALFDGVDTIDVSAIDTNLVGHFYYGDNRSVLSDLFNLIKGEAATDRFGLKKRFKNRRHYWVFQP
jgi:hypothetical protein